MSMSIHPQSLALRAIQQARFSRPLPGTLLGISPSIVNRAYSSTPPPGFKPVKPIPDSRPNPLLQRATPPPAPKPTASRALSPNNPISIALSILKNLGRIVAAKDPFSWKAPAGYVNPDPAWWGPSLQLSLFLGIGSIVLIGGHWMDETILGNRSTLRSLVNWVAPGSWEKRRKGSRKRPAPPVEEGFVAEGTEVVPRVDEEVLMVDSSSQSTSSGSLA